MTLPPAFELPQFQRRPSGWLLLAFLFVAAILLNLVSYLGRSVEPASDRYEAIEREFRTLVRLRESVNQFRIDGNSFVSADVQAFRQKLEGLNRQDPKIAGILVVFEYEFGLPIEQDTIDQLNKSKLLTDRTLGSVYDRLRSNAKFDEGDVMKSTMVLRDAHGFHYELARVHLYDEIGNHDPRQNLVIVGEAQILAIVAMFFIIGTGVLIWIIYAVQRSRGALKPLGSPVGLLTPAQSDAFAMRAAQCFLVYFSSGFLVSTIANAFKLPEPVALVLQIVFALGGVLWVCRIPVFGRRIDLRTMGVNPYELGKHVLWGIGAAIANVPMLIVAVLAGQFFFRNLPAPEHPISSQINLSMGWLQLLLLLTLSSVVAPIVEEIIFRGSMLPALNTALKRPWAAVATTSLLFAMVHPTGIPAWPALAVTGMTMALLTYQTKSLVPSIIMHATHNSMVLLLSLALQSI